MKKDHVRDYACEAFRYWALCGRPRRADLERVAVNDAVLRRPGRVGGVQTGPGAPTEAAALSLCDRLSAPEASDLLAVADTMELCDPPMKRAVEMIYLAHPRARPTKGEISERVLAASQRIPASERQIYYWMKAARDLFALKRGLRP